MFAHFPGQNFCLQWLVAVRLHLLQERTAVQQILESNDTFFTPDPLCDAEQTHHRSPPHHTHRHKPPSRMGVAQGDKLKVILIYFFVSTPILENKQTNKHPLFSVDANVFWTSLLHWFYWCDDRVPFFIPDGFSLLRSLSSLFSLCTDWGVTKKKHLISLLRI